MSGLTYCLHSLHASPLHSWCGAGGEVPMGGVNGYKLMLPLMFHLTTHKEMDREDEPSSGKLKE